MTKLNALIESDRKLAVAAALAEDIGSGDITAQLIPAEQHAKARVITREDSILCGTEWFNRVFQHLDHRIAIDWYAADSHAINANPKLCTLKGPARALLTGERTALNFLQTLSGTATTAHLYSEVVKDLPVKILDTRKTLPGLRTAQKYATLCGGCTNHRIGLYDGILIKENHIAACGSITNAVTQARAVAPGMPVEVEVETLDQIKEALAAGADSLLLDNFEIEMLCEAVTLNAGKAKLEASGGITSENLRSIAETGVNFISIGTLTKDVKAIDLSMRFLN